MTTEKNMQIWSQVCETDPAFTKSFTRGTFKGTDVNPAWRMKRLTEVFGPAGTGWGYDIKERWVDNWPGMQAACCYVRLSLWYVLDGERRETPEQIGGTVVDFAPDECWKMSITDAVGKCAMSIGLAADIYLGLFDTKYREKGETTEKYQPKTARSYVRKPANQEPVVDPVSPLDGSTPF